ncbi:hypothetical protein TrLO_g12070 [Triparma laevis f. longispina]|uniref:Uncharacterized protein n=1 Tax=Triparma laevis f. longispina TaxID=1714387 RepID=A0A9W7ANI5_9STRA|nr:hypothetical protein TrLO_g12070 [Triparma laevis f. longispina]
MSTLNVIHQRILAIGIDKDVTKKIGAYFADLDAALEASFAQYDLGRAKEVLANADWEFTHKRPTKRAKKNGSDTKPRKVYISGWTLFLKHTVMELKQAGFQGRYFVKVSVLWNALSDETKQAWKDRAVMIRTPQVVDELAKIRIQEEPADTSDETDKSGNQPPNEAPCKGCNWCRH